MRDGVIYVAGRAYHRGWQPAWRPPLRVRELLPDFEQRAPTGLQIAGGPSRWLLGFTSLVDNLGPGSSVIVGVREPGGPRMDARQLVRLANGRTRIYRSVRIRLTWRNGTPSVLVLRTCQASAAC